MLRESLQKIQAHELAAGQAKLREKEATEALDAGLAELRQIDGVTRRQLAAMRWQHARAVLSSEHKQSLIRLPSATSKGTLQQASLRKEGWQRDYLCDSSLLAHCTAVQGFFLRECRSATCGVRCSGEHFHLHAWRGRD